MFSQKLLEESNNSKFAFVKYHPHYIARLHNTLGIVCSERKKPTELKTTTIAIDYKTTNPAPTTTAATATTKATPAIATTTTTNIKNASQAKLHYTTAETLICGILESLGFAPDAFPKKQNLYLPYVYTLSRVRVKIARLLHKEILLTQKRDTALSRELLIKTLTKYREVLFTPLLFVFIYPFAPRQRN